MLQLCPSEEVPGEGSGKQSRVLTVCLTPACAEVLGIAEGTQFIVEWE